MFTQQNSATRAARGLGAFFLNSSAAIIGTAILASSGYAIWRPIAAALHLNSFAVITSTEWIFSIVCAGLIGFFVRRRWRTDTAKWVWLLPLLWFSLRAIPFIFASHSIFTGTSAWQRFSGGDCSVGLPTDGCRDFLVFTIPLVRGIAYSLAAYVASRLSKHTEPEDSVPVIVPEGLL
jgi:hypothetical protein